MEAGGDEFMTDFNEELGFSRQLYDLDTRQAVHVDVESRDIENYLFTWGLGKYIQNFKENDITLESLPFLKENMIDVLIPSMGMRAIFFSHWEKWKSCLEAAGSPASPMTTVIDASIETEMTTNSAIFPILTQHKQETLMELLQRSNDGQAILSEQNAIGNLSSNSRSKLTKLVIQRELEGNPTRRIPGERLLALSYEIKKLFPKEYASTYYVPYQSSGVGLKVSAKGKLTSYLNNLRRTYKLKGYITSRSPSTSSPSTSRVQSPAPQNRINKFNNPSATAVADVENELNWLQNSSDPWATVEVYWDLCRDARISILAQEEITISKYFNMFPCLQKPAGYLLLMKDYDVNYKASQNIYSSFPLLKERLVGVIKKKFNSTSSSAVKTSLQELLTLAEGGEEVSNLALLLSLSYLINVSYKHKGKNTDTYRPSRLEASESFITQIRTSAELEETVRRRREKMASLKLHLQPFILVIGPSLSCITEFYVSVDQYFYKLDTILAAVDTCFKLIHVLNAEYAVESKTIWTFIQLAFYNFKTQFDIHFTTVTTLLSELGIKEQAPNK